MMHTKGKLVLFVGMDRKTLAIHPADDERCRRPVVHWRGFDYTGSGTYEEDLANARRFVACWNACNGLSTEDLEQGCIQGLVDCLAAFVREYDAENWPIENETGLFQDARAALSRARPLLEE